MVGAAPRSRCLWTCIFVANALLCVSGALQRPTPKFAFDNSDNPIAVPLVLNIFMVGFDGEGAHNFKLAADTLEQYLFETMPEHHPSCMETGERLHISFELWYNVVGVHSTYLDKVQTVLSKAMRNTGETTMVTDETRALKDGEIAKEVPVYEIEVDGVVHDDFQAIYDEHSKVQRYRSKDSEQGQAANTVSYGIFIMNPDKIKMAPSGVTNDEYVYRYRTVGAGASSAWVSKDRFGVLDLSAGPSQFGHLDTGEGTVTSRTYPSVQKYLGREGDFLAHLSNNVASAVRRLFAPDIRFDALDFSEKVLVPIMVLRNHRRFDPLESGHPYSIDIKRINATLHELALPGQEIEVVWGVHALSDHERIAMAVARSAKSDTVHEARDGKFRVKAKHYIDSTMLLSEMAAASDYLSSGLLGASPVHSKTFFPDQIDTSGTRVLPVYVFSLIEDGETLLFDRDSLYASSSKAVMVIQSNVDDVDTPFFADEHMVETSAMDATSRIIAGLAEAVGGVVPPQAFYSQLTHRQSLDYQWSIGFHPFGPFSNGTQLPKLLVDLNLRNSIMSRCDAALSKVQDALLLLHHFSEAYLIDPFGAQIDNKGPPQSRIVEYLYKQQGNQAALPLAVVNRLHDELGNLHLMFEQAAEVLYYLDLVKAHTVSDRVFRKASAFHKYVLEELDTAERGLYCCGMEHTAVARTNWNIILRCAIGGLFACALVLLTLGYTPADPSHLARRFSSRGSRQKLSVN